jgi:hypothetical protein
MANVGQQSRNHASVPPHPALNTTGALTPAAREASRWSNVVSSASNLEKLRLLCHSRRERQKEGYVLDELTDTELIAKRRCQRCHGEEPLMIRSAA